MRQINPLNFHCVRDFSLIASFPFSIRRRGEGQGGESGLEDVYFIICIIFSFGGLLWMLTRYEIYINIFIAAAVRFALLT